MLQVFIPVFIVSTILTVFAYTQFGKIIHGSTTQGQTELLQQLEQVKNSMFALAVVIQLVSIVAAFFLAENIRKNTYELTMYLKRYFKIEQNEEKRTFRVGYDRSVICTGVFYSGIYVHIVTCMYSQSRMCSTVRDRQNSSRNIKILLCCRQAGCFRVS